MSPDVCFLYVIGRDEGPVKVGISQNPWGRLKQLRTGCPFPARLMHVETMRDRAHAEEHERWFHEAHSILRTAGEWFNMEAIIAVESVRTCLQLEEHAAFEAAEAAARATVQ